MKRGLERLKKGVKPQNIPFDFVEILGCFGVLDELISNNKPFNCHSNCPCVLFGLIFPDINSNFNSEPFTKILKF